MADGFVKVNQAPADFGDLGEGASRTNEFGTYPVESPEKRVERSKTQLVILKEELAQAKTDDEARSIGKEIQNATAVAQAPQNRGSRISAEVGGAPWTKVNAEGSAAPVAVGKDGWVSINQETKKAEPASGTKASDYAKSAAAGALSGTGMIAQGGGELLARGINWVGEKLGFDPKARAVNPLQGWINDILDSRTPSAKKAEADTQISGELLKPSTWSAGNDPSVAGIALQGMNAIGQFAPNLGIALVTAGASVPAQLAVGATVGGIQALGGSLDQEREAIGKMTHDDLMAGSKLYAELIGRGVPKQTAKDAVAEAAALGGGLGNSLPSAAEGAFENFLIGALTRGKFKIPSLGAGVAGRVATGVVGGGAMGGAEEAIEQAGQNIGSNIAIGGNRPIGQDTLQQFVMGMIAEGAAGGGAGLIPAGKSAPVAVAPAAAEVPPQPLTPLEQARVDGQQLKETGALPDEVQKDVERFQNAQLVAVYGENAAVNKVIEHPELTGSLKQAMLDAAPAVERVRAKLSANEQNRDITPDIVSAIDELATIRASGKTVAQVMAHGHPGDASYEAQQLMQFLDENLDNPQNLSKFMEDYLRIVETTGGVPSEVRGRAFDIIQERKSAREMEDGRHLLEQMEKKRTEDEAYAKREFDAQKRDLEIKRLKDEDRKRTQESVRSDRAEKIASELRRKAAVAKPEERTAMSIAMEKANLKGKDREKPRPASAGAVSPGEAKTPQAGAGQTGEPRGAQGSPGDSQAGAAGVEQRVRANGAEESSGAVHEDIGRAEQITLERKRAEAMGNVEVETNAIEAETGRRVKVKDRADVALKDINHQIKTMEALLECLG